MFILLRWYGNSHFDPKYSLVGKLNIRQSDWEVINQAKLNWICIFPWIWCLFSLSKLASIQNSRKVIKKANNNIWVLLWHERILFWKQKNPRIVTKLSIRSRITPILILFNGPYFIECSSTSRIGVNHNSICSTNRWKFDRYRIPNHRTSKDKAKLLYRTVIEKCDDEQNEDASSTYTFSPQRAFRL